MEISKKNEAGVLNVALSGRLDTVTSQELTKSLEGESGFEKIIFDLSALEYISSSGLRLLFFYNKKLGGKDKVVVISPNALVSEIFRVTGFDKQITIE